MITYLTRIGRYGKDIAKTAILLAKENRKIKLPELAEMAEKVEKMIKDAISGFEKEEIEPIKDFERRDDEIDSLYYTIFKKCTRYMRDYLNEVPICIHYIIIARYLERCADHACKIAEKVNYMVTGKHIEIS